MTLKLSKPQPMPAGLHTLADHERHAQSVLAPEVWSYFHGAAGDGLTAQANQNDWQRVALHPRVLQQRKGPNTSVRLLGKSIATPLLAAPMAQQGLLHADAELAMALACSALGAGMVLSTQGNTSLEHVAAVYRQDGVSHPLWFQLYPLADRAWQLELLQRLCQSGYEAVVLTVDAPIQGVRDAERRTGFSHLSRLPLPNTPRTAALPARDLATIVQQAPDWDDVHWLVQHSPLPVLLKGITHPVDADIACQAGVAGIVVSNHGGRVLDTMPSTASLLPAVAAAVDRRCNILVDGGIRRGTDVFKALALGAQAVLVGRPLAYGLANAGAAGVAHVLRLLLDEFLATLILCGCDGAENITMSHVSRNIIYNENHYR